VRRSRAIRRHRLVKELTRLRSSVFICGKWFWFSDYGDSGDYGDLSATPSTPLPLIKIHQHPSRPHQGIIKPDQRPPSRSSNIHQDQSALVRVHLWQVVLVFRLRRFRRSTPHPPLRPNPSQPRPNVSQPCPIGTSQSIPTSSQSSQADGFGSG
jgi:hypothetical protein